MQDSPLAHIASEGEPAFAPNTENDNSADSPSDKTNTDPTQAKDGEQNPSDNKEGGDKDAGLADHPRWKERESDWKERFNEQEERHTQEIQNLREEFDQKYNKPKEPSEVKIPSWFGGDEDAWNSFQEYISGLTGRAKAEAVQELKKEQEGSQKAIDEATRYMETEVSAIESDKMLNPTGEKIDRNKLLKIVFEEELVDTKGKWNYRAGYRIMKSMQNAPSKPNLADKRKIANASIFPGRGDEKSDTFKTSKDFENPGARPW